MSTTFIKKVKDFYQKTLTMIQLNGEKHHINGLEDLMLQRC